MTQSLLEIYTLKESGRITEEEAAAAFNKSVTLLRRIYTIWGNRLPLLFSCLDKIRDNKISRTEAAELLNVSLRHVNQLMTSWAVMRPIPERKIRQEAASIKWSVRQKFAIDWIADACTIEEAAENAQVSVRQMRRWVSELLEKHYDMTVIQLRRLPLERRRRLAEEIEEKIGLDLATQQLLKTVLDGRKSIQEEATERVVAKRARKLANVR